MTGTDSDLREPILMHALSDVPYGGFSQAVLNRAAEKSGAAVSDLKSLFPNGPSSLIEAFSDWADARTRERMQAFGDAPMRERVAHAVRARLEALSEHKDAARRAAAFLAMPMHAPLGARLLYKAVDCMWRAAGDKATDFSFYTKRATLSAVYGATMLYWLTDSSEGHKATWEFLDNRIQEVMRIETWRRGAENLASHLPDPFEVLGAIRAGARKPT
jgi:ubiquinone biosynthesis protein COQ9